MTLPRLNNATSWTSTLPLAREWLARSLITHFITTLPPSYVSVSDVDELLDPQSIHSVLRRAAPCVRPKQRPSWYSPFCEFATSRVHKGAGTWMNSVILNSGSRWFANFAAVGEVLRYHPALIVDHCKVTDELVGWHLSYAFSTDAILHKLSTFSHAHDEHVVNFLSAPDARSKVADRVRRCIHLFSEPGDRLPSPTHYNPHPYDGRLPPLPGWPHNADAPNS